MIGEGHLASLAALLKERVGLHVRPDSYGSLRLALSMRVGDRPAPEEIDSYLAGLIRGEDELRRLLPLVTVGKTSFFRDERQFAALQEVLPGLLERARLRSRPLSIWSAACATGEEVYSLAIAAAEAGAAPHELELLGSDVNPKAVVAASAGRFRASRTGGLDPERLERNFERDGDNHVARPHLRRLASRFQVHNLNQPTYPVPATGEWDVIFCRNVLIYFDLPTSRRVLERLHRALRPGGLLFLGYSESLFRVFDGFELVEHEGSFFYRKPSDIPNTAPPPTPPMDAPRPVACEAPEKPPAPAAPRIELLPPDCSAAVRRIEAGLFDEARALLETQLVRMPEDLGIRLTLGNLYALLRLPAEARACYEASVAAEPLCAEGHLLLGMHLLGQGELEGAAAELGRALFLEPDCALAHLFLGRCRERQRDLDAARRCYRNAMASGARSPQGHKFVGFYPDLPADPAVVARTAESALATL